MGIQVEGPAGVAAEVDLTYDAFRVTCRPPQGDGWYFHQSTSGALAGAAAASVVWAFRWTHATKAAVIEFLRVRALPTTPFTAAQAWGFDAVVGRGYTVAHTGGTQYLPSGAGGWKKRTSYTASNVSEIRMATTAALGGGTVTPDASPFLADWAWELVAGATVARSKIVAEKDYTNSIDAPTILVANEGILVRPTDTLGAGGVVRLGVEIAWREIDASAFG